MQKSREVTGPEKRRQVAENTSCARHRMRKRSRYFEVEIVQSQLHGGNGFQSGMCQVV